MVRSTHSLAFVMTLAFVHHALAQNPTVSLIPLVEDVRRECVGGLNDGQACTTAADCEVGPECQRVCAGFEAPDAGTPCSEAGDCSPATCTQPCSCNYVISASPGDVITTEAFVSNWLEDGSLLRGWQVSVDMEPTFDSVRLLGFDGPDTLVLCFDGVCPEEYPFCTSDICLGANHNPERGSFIDATREDFVFYDQGGGVIVTFGFFRQKASGLNLTGVTVSGSRYLWTLILEIQPKAKGRIDFPFEPPKRTALTTTTNRIPPIDLENLTINIVEPPPPPETIPATSTWGIVALSLFLMAGAKICFKRRQFPAA